MTTPESKRNLPKEMIEALAGARDRARLQAHLFSLDTRMRWQALETTLLDLQSRLEKSGEELAASTANGVRDVTKAFKELMREVDGTLELATGVRKLMKQDPSRCGPDDTLARAAQIMWDVDCGAVPVVDTDGAVVGMLTDRDICMAAYTRGQPLAAMSVRSAMSKDVHACSPEDSIGHAARLMAEKQVRRLPVVENGRLVGLLTLADLAKEVRNYGGNRAPACVALADALASICERRARAAPRAQAAE